MFSSVRRHGFVAAVVLGTGLFPTAGAAAASSAGEPSAAPVLGAFSFTGAVQTFRSSTHKRLLVGLFATTRHAASDTAPHSVTVTVRRKGASESHSWDFQLPNPSAFSYDEDARRGNLTTGSSIKPYGSLALTLTAVGRETVVGCGRTRANDQRVKVSGTMRFDTHSTGKSRWGRIAGSHRVSFTGRSIVSIFHPADMLCRSQLPPCVTTMSWLAHKTSNGNDEVIQQELATTVGAKTTYRVSGERIRHLAKPASAVRTDTTTRPAPRTTFRFPASAARVKVRPRAPSLTGSARLASVTMTESVALACGSFPQTATTTAWTATYHNAQRRLTLNEQIEGGFHLPNRVTSADIERIVPNG